MRYRLPGGHEISELKIHQFALGALGVAALAAENVLIGVASLAPLTVVMIVETAKK
jgi:hypothetical protein